MAQILLGKVVAEKIYKEIEKDLVFLDFKKTKPVLAIIVIGDDPLSEKYIDIKVAKAKELEVKTQIIQYPSRVSQETIVAKIDDLNRSSLVRGIVVQFPLPKQIDSSKVTWAIAPEKDVDGFQMRNFRPPAPMAVVDLLLHYKIPVLKKKIALVGYGALVGKPLATLLSKQGANIYVYDQDNPISGYKLKQANVVISAVGIPNIITSDLVGPEQVIIDAGTSSDGKTIVGDVDFEGVRSLVKAISPVPGGVGVVTVAELFRNFVKAAKMQQDKETQRGEQLAGASKTNSGPFINRKR